MSLQSTRNWRVASYGRRAGLLAGLALLVAGTALAPLHATQAGALRQAATRGTIPHTDVDPFGANVFLHKEAEQAKVTKTLDLAQSAHLPWIKQDFPWNDIEIEKKGDFTDRRNGTPKSAWDKYDFIVDQAVQRGVQVVARVSFAPAWARDPAANKPEQANNAPQNNDDLADFVVALLKHYNGRVRYVQVWNEPNLNYEWKTGGKVDPTAYVAMLKTVYTKAKAADPKVTILSAPMAITLENLDYAGNLNELDYWDQMYQAGAKDYFDILSANAYGLDLPPADPPGRDKLNFRRVELLHDVMVRNGDTNKAVWFNEYGWNAAPTSLSQEEQLHWRRVEPDVQAKWTVDGIQYAQDHWPWSGVFFIWYLRQAGDIPADKAEYYFGLVAPDFSLTTAYKAVRRAAGLYKGPGAQTAPGIPTPGPGTPTQGAAASATAVATSAVGGAAGATPTGTVIAATPVPQPAPDGSSGSNTLPLIGGIILVLLGLGAVGYFLMRKPGTNT